MAIFVKEQMDYIYFLYGLGFIILAAVCFALTRLKNQRLPWVWLGLFGLLHGASEWMELLCTSLTLGSTLGSIRVYFLLLSCVCLMEFGRLGYYRLTHRGPGRWVILPLLALASLGVMGDLRTVDISLRYALALTSGLYSAITLYSAYKHARQRLKAPLAAAAAVMTMYAFTSGLIVSRADFFPASMFNRDTFTMAFGVPVQLFRVALVICITAALYVYFHRSMYLRIGSDSRSAAGVYTAAVILGFVISGWYLTQAIGKQADATARHCLLSRTCMAATALHLEDVTRLTGRSSDISSPAYQQIRHRLLMIKSCNPDCRGAYLIAPKNGRIVFLADAEPSSAGKLTPPGLVYQDATDTHLRSLKDGKPRVDGPVNDEWGIWASGLKGIRDPIDGRVVALFGIDIDAQNWQRTVAQHRLFCIAIVLLICMLSIAFFEILVGKEQAKADMRMQTSAINAAGDQIMIMDAQGNIKYVNASFERETGYQAHEVTGKNLAALRSEKHPESFYEDIWNCVLAGNVWHGEITNRRRDGTVYIDDVTVTPIIGDDGSIEHFIAILRNITDKKDYEKQLNHLAHHDVLTSLPNRLLFSDRLTQRLAQARHNGSKLAVMFFDLDNFKVINDTLGHNIGDMLLKQVAERLTHTLREVDTIARMGGDEFSIILSDINEPQDAALVANRVLHVLSQPFNIEGRELFISTSIGISLFPSDGSDVETLVKNADTAMYMVKAQGRNGCRMYTDDLNNAIVERMNLEKCLRNAIEKEEIFVHYQPQMEINTGRIIGMEALIRWQHPEFGVIPAARFMALAEETGLIVQMSEAVIKTASIQNKLWQDQGLQPMPVSIDVSARQFQQTDLVGTVKSVLDETGLPPDYLILEIAEGTLMANPDMSIVSLRVLKSMGVRIIVDHFGTGYSSLSYLKRFPIDGIKIDQSFVRNITNDPDDAEIAGAAIAMAHRLKLKVIAEGVETLEQLELLRSLNCDEIQGYFVSQPLLPEEMPRILQEETDTLQVA